MYIYKLSCKNSDDIYIGRTKNIKKRLSLHEHEVNNRTMYDVIKNNGGFDCEILEEVDNIDLSKERERYYYDLYQPSLNTNIPNRKPKEYYEKYYVDKKDEINEKTKLYYKKNSELIKTKNLLRYYKNKCKTSTTINYKEIVIDFD
jgi:predicted GIY-YIG superfamily endonuclease